MSINFAKSQLFFRFAFILKRNRVILFRFFMCVSLLRPKIVYVLVKAGHHSTDPCKGEQEDV